MKTKTRDYNSNVLQPKLFYCLFVFYIIIWRKLNHLVAWVCRSQIVHLGDKARKQYCSNFIRVLLRFYFGHDRLCVTLFKGTELCLKEQNCGVYKIVFFFLGLYAWVDPKIFFSFGKTWPCFAVSEPLFHNKILGSLALFIKNNQGGLPEAQSTLPEILKCTSELREFPPLCITESNEM